MARESKGATLSKMIRVVQTVNALSPLDTTKDGETLSLERFAQLAGLSPKDCSRIITKINYGCGDALPAAWVDFDEEVQTVTPHRLLLAYDGFLKLSRPEAFSLLLALKTSGIDPDGHLVRKLVGALPDFELDRFSTVGGTSGMPPSTLDVLADAIAHRAVLALVYSDAAGNMTRRLVEPLSIWYDNIESTWSFYAWCRLREAFRVFRCDRLVEAPVRTGETFAQRGEQEVPGGFESIDGAVRALLAVHDPATLGTSRVWRGIEPVLDAEVEVRYLRKQEIEGDGFVATIPWAENSPWLVHALVRTLGGVEALEPAALRSQVAEHARSLLARLDDASENRV